MSSPLDQLRDAILNALGDDTEHDDDHCVFCDAVASLNALVNLAKAAEMALPVLRDLDTKHEPS
jgi:hypothetical protein